MARKPLPPTPASPPAGQKYSLSELLHAMAMDADAARKIFTDLNLTNPVLALAYLRSRDLVPHDMTPENFATLYSQLWG